MLRDRVLVGVLPLLSLLSGCSAIEEESAGSNDALEERQECAKSASCVVAGTALKGTITEKLATEIDSGWLQKGPVKVRTRFTIDPPKGEPLLTVDMPKGAQLEASWSPSAKGKLTLRPRTEKGAEGEMKVRYTLVPALQADLWGAQVNYDSTQLLEKLAGRDFNYDAQTEAKITPWGFEGAEANVPAPRLSESTIFGLPFSDLGVGPEIAEGRLAIQAVARPTFVYKTKSVQLDSESVRKAEGTTTIFIGDSDAVDVVAHVEGEIDLSGSLDIRPVVAPETIAGIPTFGLVDMSFSVASKDFGGVSPVQFEPAAIHIPLPNVKVPKTPFSIGTATSTAKISKAVTIENTGELAAVFTVESSNPQFTVPAGTIRIDPKSSYELEIAFAPEGSGPASSTITVKSNDPDSPKQSIKVSANGPPPPAAEEDEAAEDADEPETNDAPVPTPRASDGCSLVATGTGAPAVSPFALALGLALLVRRRRR